MTTIGLSCFVFRVDSFRFSDFWRNVWKYLHNLFKTPLCMISSMAISRLQRKCAKFKWHNAFASNISRLYNVSGKNAIVLRQCCRRAVYRQRGIAGMSLIMFCWGSQNNRMIFFYNTRYRHYSRNLADLCQHIVFLWIMHGQQWFLITEYCFPDIRAMPKCIYFFSTGGFRTH